MAAKEMIGKSKLCIVLSILERICQYFILYILEVIDSEYAKKISKKPLYIYQKTIIYIFFIYFLMHWAIKREDLYIEHYSWRFIYNGWQWSTRLIWSLYMNMSTQGPIMLVFIKSLTDSTVRMQTTHWYLKEHTSRGLAQNQHW